MEIAKSFRFAVTVARYNGASFGEVLEYLNTALSLLEVNTPFLTASVICDVAKDASLVLMRFAIRKRRELANFAHLPFSPL
ncbi:hypothetical protein D3C86_1456990 [compost metagenome]